MFTVYLKQLPAFPRISWLWCCDLWSLFIGMLSEHLCWLHAAVHFLTLVYAVRLFMHRVLWIPQSCAGNMNPVQERWSLYCSFHFIVKHRLCWVCLFWLGFHISTNMFLQLLINVSWRASKPKQPLKYQHDNKPWSVCHPRVYIQLCYRATVCDVQRGTHWQSALQCDSPQ